jgi:hypothetical protein
MRMIAVVRAYLRAGLAAALLALLAASAGASPGVTTSAKAPRSVQDPAQTCTLARALVNQAMLAPGQRGGGPGGGGQGGSAAVAAQLRGLANASQDDAVQEQLTYAADAAQALAAASQAGDTAAADGARQVLVGFGHACPVANGLFANGTSGWAGTTATTRLTTAGAGPAGGNALQVAATSAGACGFQDAPHVVTATLPGTYTLRLWVRAAAGSPAVTAQLSELSGASVVGRSAATVTATSGWQQLRVILRPKANSGLAIDVSSTPTAAGACFEAADVSLTRG